MEQTFLNQYIPYSQEAEEAVIGAVLVNKASFYGVASFLTAEDFFILRHQHIWQAMVNLNLRGDEIDYITVVQELKNADRLDEIGGPAYITQLINNTPTSIHAEVYGRLVERAAIRRRLLAAADRIKLLALDEEMTVERVMDEAESELFGVSERQLARELVPMREALSQYYDHIEGLMQASGEPLGLPTGFKDLDKLLGGLQRSDLLVFAGRPGMGKSSFLLSVALNLARLGRRIAIFTMEMGVDQIVQRMVSMEAAINSQKLRLGNLSQQEWVKFVQVVDNLSHFHVFIDDTPAMTPLQMRSKCFRLAREHGIDLVILDYMQLMNSGGSYENNRVQEISYISRSMKELARELNVPILSAAQLSRAVEQRQDKRPVLSDLRESGCLAGESLVYLPDSGCYAPIRELCGRADFRVMSLNTETWKLESDVVTHAFCTGVKPVYRLTTQLGRTIRATANHKFLTIHGWKRLDELAEHEPIALPRRLDGPVAEQTMTDAELGLLGHLIGDGCTLPRYALQYTTREKDLAQIVVDLAAEVFGDEVRSRIYEEPGHSWYQVFLPPTRHLTHGVRNPVRMWLEEMGVFGLRSHEKHVPIRVFAQPEEAIAVFLRHLWATDGCITVKGTNDRYYPLVYYATSSERLARDVQSLLLRLEINARLSRIPQNGKGRDQFHIIVSGASDLRNFVEAIHAVGDRRREKLAEVTEYLRTHPANTNRDVIPRDIWRMYAVPAMQENGITSRQMQAEMRNAYCGTGLYKQNVSRERAGRLAQIVKADVLGRTAVSDVYWDTIASIEFDGEAEVFDLTVNDRHNFVAADIIVHNSIEQDSDIVMFLYRDEVYNEATEFPNQAEIIIAKHRNGPTGTISLYFDKTLTKFLNATERSIDLSHM